MLFCTDSRSEKVLELRSNARAEVSWYFPMTREQFRLRCRAHLITKEDQQEREKGARAAAWASLSDKDRLEFCSLAPGAVWVDPKAAAQDIDLDLYDSQNLDKTVAVEHFLVVSLEVDHVDYLTTPPPVADEVKPRHRESPRESLLQQNKVAKRFLHKREPDGQWTIVRVNP